MLRIALTALVAASIGASSAQAAPSADDVVQVRVSYADLDVATHAGSRALMQRIAKAAGAVCGGGPDSVIHDDRVRFERCRTEAFGRAVQQLRPTIVDAVADYPPGAVVVTAR